MKDQMPLTEPVSAFHGAVDDDLALCEEECTKPEIAYKGSLNVRFKVSMSPTARIQCFGTYTI